MVLHKFDSSKKATIIQKKASTDLWIILITTFVVLGIFMNFSSVITDSIKAIGNKELSLFLHTLVYALIQFGVAGLGITIVLIQRKESILGYGLRKRNLLITLALSALVYIPSIIFQLVTGDATSYLPFQQVAMTRDVLSASIPLKIIGMLLIATSWGFFEGFNYVVIADKINTIYPTQHKWLDIGAITCAVMCILIHGAIGLTPKDFIEMLTTLFVIYGMLMVRKFTGNAWGCVFIFVFFWNAI